MHLPYITTLVSYIKKPAKQKSLRVCIGLKNKKGIEIGGPSDFFKLKSYFPVYAFAKQIDGVNFSAETVWEGKLKEGFYYNYYRNRKGFQFIAEASDLSKIKSDSYDFVLSCHNLEHVANVIQALKEWRRILKPGGIVALILPDKNFTFDHNRPYTTFEHLVADFENKVDEKDVTSFNEIMQKHDLSMDKEVNTYAELKKRLDQNFVNRCVHHHVFNNELAKQVLEFCSFKIIEQKEMSRLHLFTLAQKTNN